MKRLAMIAVTGVMSFMLSACGGDDAPNMSATQGGDDMMQQTQMPMPSAEGQNVQEQMPAADNAMEVPQPTHNPSEEQVEGATAAE